MWKPAYPSGEQYRVGSHLRDQLRPAKICPKGLAFDMALERDSTTSVYGHVKARLKILLAHEGQGGQFPILLHDRTPEPGAARRGRPASASAGNRAVSMVPKLAGTRRRGGDDDDGGGPEAR